MNFVKLCFVTLLLASSTFANNSTDDNPIHDKSTDDNSTLGETSEEGNLTERIVGGADAEIGKWPFYAYLRVGSAGRECGCVIVSRLFVLTANECAEGAGVNEIYVHAGFQYGNLGSFLERSQALKIHFFPGFVNKDRHNILLVELKIPLFYNKLVKPVTLPRDSFDVVKPLTSCKIIGFGNTDTEGYRLRPDKSQQLQEGDIVIYTKSTCTSFWGTVIKDSHVCGNEPSEKSGICYGDEGSPLVCEDPKTGKQVLRGIASFLPEGCAHTSVPDVFERVSYYMDWLEDLIDYTPWVIGDCSVSCGTGTRLDRRECHGDDCGNKRVLDRVSQCEMPPCPDGKDVCRELKCSPSATCQKFSGLGKNPEYHCKCLPNFKGNGTLCAYDLVPETPKCRSVAAEDRLDCGYAGIGDQECVNKGCCWDVTEDGAPWCFSNKAGPDTVYGDWQLGVCEGHCGIGTRRDTRSCVHGNCDPSDQSRDVQCWLQRECAYQEGCRALNLSCHVNARCVKYSSNPDFECECEFGYYGNGVRCNGNGASPIAGKRSVLAIAVLVAALLRSF